MKGLKGTESSLLGTESRLRHEYVYAFLMIVFLLLLPFYNVVFLGRTFLTSPLCPGTMPTGPYGYTGQAAEVEVRDPGASAWQNEPLAVKIREEALTGKLPLWNPNSGVGAPLLANIISAPFSPFRVMLYGSTSPIVWDLYFLIRLLAAGFFTYVFLRTMTTSPLGSMAGAISFMFCGYFIQYVNMCHLDVDVLIPLTLLAFEYLFRDCRPRNVVLSAFVVCFTVLGGMPESTFFVLLFAFLYYFFRVIWSKSHETPKTARFYLKHSFRFSSAVVLGMLLSGPQLLPFLEYAFQSSAIQVTHGTTTGAGSAALIGSISIMVPHFFGRMHAHWNGMSAHGLIAYVGVLPIFLALMGTFAKSRDGRNKLKWFFAIFALLFVFKGYGFLVINWIGYLPIFNRMIFPKYCAPEFAFSVAALAAMGTDALIQGTVSKKKIRFASALLVGFILVYLGARPFDLFPQLNDIRIVKYVSLQAGSAFFLIGIAYLLASWSQQHEERTVAIACLTVLLLGELLFYVPRGRATRYDPATVPPFVNFLKRDEERFRVLGHSVLYPNSSSFFNMDCITDLNPMYPLRYMTDLRGKSCLRTWTASCPI